jgi:hypothetical protein
MNPPAMTGLTMAQHATRACLFRKRAASEITVYWSDQYWSRRWREAH